MTTKKTQHTPGPWTAVPVESGVRRRNLVYVKIQAERSLAYANVGDRDGEVAGAYAELPAGRSRGVTIFPGEALANARLIAQAPEMYAEIKALVETADEVWAMGRPVMHLDAEPVANNTISVLRRILAAVEGK